MWIVNLLPWLLNNWKILTIGISIAIALAIGWHMGATHIQTKWDAAKVQEALAEGARRTAEQQAADAAGKFIEDKLAAKDAQISNITQELANEQIKLSVCGKLHLPASSVRAYEGIAAAR